MVKEGEVLVELSVPEMDEELKQKIAFGNGGARDALERLHAPR